MVDPSHIFSYEEWQKIMTRQNNYIWYQLYVFLAMGTQYIDIGYTGVNIIDVDGGLNAAEFVSAQDAYIAYVKLMEQLNKNGWKQYFRAHDPRIANRIISNIH